MPLLFVSTLPLSTNLKKTFPLDYRRNCRTKTSPLHDISSWLAEWPAKRWCHTDQVSGKVLVVLRRPSGVLAEHYTRTSTPPREGGTRDWRRSQHISLNYISSVFLPLRGDTKENGVEKKSLIFYNETFWKLTLIRPSPLIRDDFEKEEFFFC